MYYNLFVLKKQEDNYIYVYVCLTVSKLDDTVSILVINGILLWQLMKVKGPIIIKRR